MGKYPSLIWENVQSFSPVVTPLFSWYLILFHRSWGSVTRVGKSVNSLDCGPYGLCHNYCVLLWSSQRQYLQHLGFNETFLTTAGSRQEFDHGPVVCWPLLCGWRWWFPPVLQFVWFISTCLWVHWSFFHCIPSVIKPIKWMLHFRYCSFHYRLYICFLFFSSFLLVLEIKLRTSCFARQVL